jgi:alpha-D-ribose 1-methylphosphonate 5-triphosphate synthase subunit PhnG
MSHIETEDTLRRARLGTLAKASAASLLPLWQGWVTQNGMPEHETLRAAEIGTVMVRGRAGAVGAPFNLGEISVTRCSVRLASGHVGHGYVQGRDKQAAQAVALIDALAQGKDQQAIDLAITGPLAAAAEQTAGMTAARAAATRVEFFTMVRGEG